MKGIITLCIILSCTAQAFSQSGAYISLSKGPCFGRCPEYTVTFYTNGKITYTGIRNTAWTGDYYQIIPRRIIDRLFNAFRKADFFRLKESYPASVSDLPAITLTYATGKRSKTIKGIYNAPGRLHLLLNMIDSITDSKQAWRQ